MSDNDLKITISSKLASDFVSTFSGAKKQVGGLRDEIIKLRKQQSLIKKFEMDMSAATKAKQRLGDIRQQIKELDYQIKRDRKLGINTKSAQSSIQKLAKQAGRLESAVSSANSKLIRSKQALNDAGLSARRSANEYDRLDSKIKNLGNSYSNLKAKAAGKLGLSQGFADLRSQATSTAIKIGAVGFAIKKMTDSANNLQALNSAYKAIFGTVEAGATQMDFVRKASDRLGLNFVSLAGAYKNWAAAAEESSMKGKVQQEVFMSIASASKVLGLSTENTKGALNALSQMISKGTVSSEELKQQLGEHLPGAFGLAAKSMGVTTAELGKMLQKGEVMASDLLPRLANELNKKYGAGLSDASNLLAADTERLNNQINVVSTTFGTILTPVVQRATRSFTEILSSVNDFASAHPQLVTGAMAAAGALLALSTVTIAVRGTMLLMNSAALASSGAFATMLGPIGLAAVALAGLIGVVDSWITENDRINASVRLSNGALMTQGEVINRSSALSAEYVIATKERRAQIKGEVHDLIVNSRAHLENSKKALEAAYIKQKAAEIASAGSFNIASRIAGKMQADWYKSDVRVLTSNVAKSSLTLKKLEDQYNSLGKTVKITETKVHGIKNAFAGVSTASGTLAKQTKKAAKGFSDTQKQAKKIKETFTSYTQTLEKERNQIKLSTLEQFKHELSLKNLSAAQVKQLVDYKKQTLATKNQIEAEKAADKQAQKLTDTYKRYSAGLVKERNNIKLSTLEQFKQELSFVRVGKAKQKLSAIDIKRLVDYKRGTIELKKQKEAQEKATKKLEESRKTRISALKTVKEYWAAEKRGFPIIKGLTLLESKHEYQQRKLWKARQEATKAIKESNSALELAQSALGKTDQETRALALSTKDGYTSAMATAQAATEAQTKKLEAMRAAQVNATKEIKAAKTALEINSIKLNQGADAARLFELKTKGYSKAQAESKLNIEKTNKALEKHGEVVKSIEGALTDAAMDGFKSFKDLGRKITDIFKSMVLRPVVQAVMSPISGAIAGMMPGGAQAGGIGGIGGAGGLGGGIAGLKSMIFGNSIGTGIANLGSNIGLGGLFSGGAGGGFMASNLGFGIAGLGGGLLGGMFGGNGSTGGSIGGVIGNAILPGVGGLIGSLLGGALGGAIGPKTRFKFDQNVTDKENGEYDFDGNPNSKRGRVSKISAFGLNHRSTQIEKGTSKEWAESFQKTLDAMVSVDNAVADFASKSQMKNIQKNIKNSKIQKTSSLKDFFSNRVNLLIDGLGGSVEQYINKFEGLDNKVKAIGEIADVNKILPQLDQLGPAFNGSLEMAVRWGDELKTQGETLANSLARSAQNFSVVSDSATLLNFNFGGTGVSILKASNSLVQFMGGLEQFSAATSKYYQNFYSEQERGNIALATASLTIKQFNESLGKTGDSAITSKEGFRKYIESLDLTSEAGQKAFASAMKIQDSFINLGQSGKTLEEALASLPASSLKTATAVLASANTQEEAGNKVSAASNEATQALSSVGGSLSGLASRASSAASSISSSLSSISNTKAEIESTLQSAKATKARIESEAATKEQETDGSHSAGLFSVPKDNYKANLHKDEMVLPARLARILQKGGSLNGGSNIASIKPNRANKRAAALLSGSMALTPMAAAAQGNQQSIAPVTQNISITINAAEGTNEQDIADQVVKALEKAKADAAREQRNKLHDGRLL